MTNTRKIKDWKIKEINSSVIHFNNLDQRNQIRLIIEKMVHCGYDIMEFIDDVKEPNLINYRVKKEPKFLLDKYKALLTEYYNQ